MSIQARMADAFKRHRPAASVALILLYRHLGRAFKSEGATAEGIALAWLIEHGKSPEEAAARRYLYRWHLYADYFVNHTQSRSLSRLRNAPHLLGL